MINLHELRIGSLLLDAKGKIFTVDKSFFNRPYAEKEFSPIVIGHATFEVVGLKYVPNGRWFLPCGRFFVARCKNGSYGFFSLMNGHLIDFRHIHTLQNIYFSLTNTELIQHEKN